MHVSLGIDENHNARIGHLPPLPFVEMVLFILWVQFILGIFLMKFLLVEAYANKI